MWFLGHIYDKIWKTSTIARQIIPSTKWRFWFLFWFFLGFFSRNHIIATQKQLLTSTAQKSRWHTSDQKIQVRFAPLLIFYSQRPGTIKVSLRHIQYETHHIPAQHQQRYLPTFSVISHQPIHLVIKHQQNKKCTFWAITRVDKVGISWRSVKFGT